MLRHLYIKNYTLIDELDIDFFPGFSVITGETGAGKSIILGALGLLLGNRADVKQIKSGETKCVIEAQFDLEDSTLSAFFTDNDIDYDGGECILRREVNASGKSRAFVNDTPVQLALLKELGEHLIDIHSQHQNLLLQKDDFMLSIVDVIAHNSTLRGQFDTLYARQHECRKQLDSLKERIEKNRANEDFLRFQFQELERDHFADGEQEELEQQSETLSHAEEIKSALYTAQGVLSGDDTNVIGQLRATANSLHAIEDVYAPAAELAQRIDSAYVELKDIADEISSGAERVDFSPEQLNTVNTRLDALYALEQKYHVGSVAELLAIKSDIAAQLSSLDNSSDELAAVEAAYTQAYQACMAKAQELRMSRAKAARKVEAELSKRLVPLGIPNVRFQIQMSDKALSSDGIDRLQFYFSANKNTPLQPIAQIASGGEIARVMLSLKAMVSGAVKLPTIIFDEIDTGVSGRVAEQMAHIMREMGDTHRQVISITHLPQIAAVGTTHYKVSKEDRDDTTVSHMRLLCPEERVAEIAQMLSGNDITPAAIENAKSLLRI